MTSAGADPFAGRTVLVTGAASGIGAAVSRRAAQGGANVVLVDLDADAGAQLAEKLDGVFVRADVGELEGNAAAVQVAVERFGRLDIAHLNAGIGGPGYARREQGPAFDVDRYRRTIAVNLDGVALGAHVVLEQFRRQGGGGAILATASMAGVVPTPGGEIYAATKHAVVGLVRSLAVTVQGEGITVNALCPGFVDTPLLRPVLPALRSAGIEVELASADTVAEVAARILAGGGTGQAWSIMAGQEPQPLEFPSYGI